MSIRTNFFGGISFLYLQLAESYRTAAQQTQAFSLAISKALNNWGEWRAFMAQEMMEKAAEMEDHPIGQASVLPLPYIEASDSQDSKAEAWATVLAKNEDILGKTFRSLENRNEDIKEKIQDAEARRDILKTLAQMIQRGEVWAYYGKDRLWSCEFCGYSWHGYPASGCPHCHIEDWAQLTPQSLAALLKCRF